MNICVYLQDQTLELSTVILTITTGQLRAHHHTAHNQMVWCYYMQLL